MPGKHTAREKRQAKHIAESERARGIDPKRAESIGWATVNAQKGRRVKKNIPGMGLPAGGAYPAMGKGTQIVPLDAYYDSVVKARATEQSEGGNKARPKKLPRDLSLTARMCPVPDDEAVDQLRKKTRRHSEKSLRWLTALKALATGYTKVSGGGALKTPNRGYPSKIRKNKEEKVEKMYPTLSASARSITSSRESPKVLDGGSSAELSNSLRNVVNKSGGPMANTTDFNDLFKSELGTSTGGVLCECPHCDAPITKSDLAKAHKGKGKVTHLSGPKHGKSGAHVSEQNPEGGVMRGGTGHGVHTSSRGVPGAEKVDEVHVQSTDRSKRKNAAKHQGNMPSKQIPRVEKAEHDSSSDDSSSGDDASSAPPKMKKSITYRGTDHVMYIDDGSDAALAKAILEGSLGGTPPTQPLDLNNDLTRLLI